MQCYELFYVIILGAEHFEELVTLVKEHYLFKEAMKLYPKSSEQHKVWTVQLFRLVFDLFSLLEFTLSVIGAHGQGS